MIRAIERALLILDSFDTAHPRQTLQEIASRTNLSKATAFRLVGTLVKGGYLLRDEAQKYRLSLEVLRLSSFAEVDINIQAVLRPLMAQVGKQAGETVALYTSSGSSRVCIETVQIPSPLMRIVIVGEQVPLIRGAIGRTLLAQMTDSENEMILAESALPKNDPMVLRKRIEIVRHRGYDVARSERVVGATAIAVPIHHRLKSGAHYCLAIVGPSARIDDRLEELTLMLRKAGQKASRELGAD
ncbi:MAG: IclR family transcriptional regulator [Pseudolabrys sp.]